MARHLAMVQRTGGYAPRLTIVFLASGFSCSQALSTPAPPPLTQTVSLLIVVKFLGVILEKALYLIVEFPKSYATLQRRPCLLPQPQRVEIYRRTGGHHPPHRTAKIRFPTAQHLWSACHPTFWRTWGYSILRPQRIPDHIPTAGRGKNHQHHPHPQFLRPAHFTHLAPLFSNRHSGLAGATQHPFV